MMAPKSARRRAYLLATGRVGFCVGRPPIYSPMLRFRNEWPADRVRGERFGARKAGPSCGPAAVPQILEPQRGNI